MKFKVGDEVKFVKSIEIHSDKAKLGDTYKIEYVQMNTPFLPYRAENGEWFGEEELSREYTYENLKKSPIGTKITFEDKKINIRKNEEWFTGECPREIADLKNLKDNYGKRGKIIKIEEPTYQTVYEVKLEVLDQTEKRYLRNFIAPFKDSVETIRRLYSPTKEKDYIQIRYKDDRPTNLPYFESNTMYKNMEINKNYTLEELDL